MPRDKSVIDFPALVAAKMIRDTKLGLRLKPSGRIKLTGYVTKKDSPLVTFTETDLGNLTFICPNCNRQNILTKQEIVIAMCKFCPPAESPD